MIPFIKLVHALKRLLHPPLPLHHIPHRTQLLLPRPLLPLPRLSLPRPTEPIPKHVYILELEVGQAKVREGAERRVEDDDAGEEDGEGGEDPDAADGVGAGGGC